VPPLDNVDVRKAINYAIDRTQILEEWGGPLAGNPTDQLIPPALVDYQKYSLYPNTPDLAMAKKLMAASGVKTPVTVGLRVINDEPGFVNMGSVIKADLAPLGIKVDLLEAPNSVNSSIISNYKTHTAMGIEPWSADFPDGEAIINTGLDPATPDFAANFSHFGVHSWVAPFEKAAAALGAARVAAYKKLDYDLMADQAPYAPLLNPRWYDFVSTRIGGYTYSQALDAINYNTLYVKS
jgi:peptide/nickel transport system substrate-binding protein